jgi:hypothetical protein
MHIDPDEPDPARWDGAQWELASLLLAAALAVMPPPGLLLAFAALAAGLHRWGRTELLAAAIGGYAAGAVLVALSLVAISFGLTGLGAARRYRRPTALPLAGLLLGAFDVFAWHGAVWNGF